MINLNLDHRQIGLLVAADNLGVMLHAGRVILQPHPYAVRLLYHMAVRNNEALGIDQNA